MRRLALLAAACAFLGASALQASESTTRLRLPGSDAPPAAAPGAVPPSAPASAPAAAGNLRLRLTEPAKGPPIAPDPAGAAAARTLPDGTLAVSAQLLTLEMVQNEQAARDKYTGKAIQFQGALDYQLVNENAAYLGFTVSLPAVGYKRFLCISFDRDSMAAARAAKKGQEVVMAGIFVTADVIGQTQAAQVPGMKYYDTLNFAECVVLTGHPNPALARALVAGWASARRIGK